MAASSYITVVQQLYVAYFGRPADTVGLDNFTKALDAAKAPTDIAGLAAAYSTNATIKALVDSFGNSAESTALYTGTTAEFVAAVYQNVLNRAPDFAGLTFWANAIDHGGLSKGNAALAIMSGALSNTTAQGLLDAKVVTNKIAIATNFTTSIDTSAELLAYSGDAAAASARAMLATVTDTTTTTAFAATIDSTLTSLVNAYSRQGKTLTLTTGVDAGAAFTGGSGDDTFVATSTTLTALDQLTGGAGTDTLSILDTAGTNFTTAGFSMSGIEKVAIRAATGTVTFDSSAMADVTNVSVTQAVNSAITAASTTDVSISGTTGTVSVTGGKTVGVSGAKGNVTILKGVDVTVSTATAGVTTDIGQTAGKEPTGAVKVTNTAQTGYIKIDGGTTVDVTASTDKGNGGAITIGATKAASGAVNVTSTLTNDGAASYAGGAIAVTGGSSINVTQTVTETAKDQTVSGVLTASAVTVNGDGKTTTVSVIDNLTANTNTKVGSDVVKETSVVTFNAMKTGETLTINGLTFTAAKDLTAAQVAAAFSNLTAADTQSSGGITTNGTYSNTFNTAVWTSGAANGNVVTFTAQDEDETDLAFTGTATTNDAGARIPTQVKTAGTAAVADVVSTDDAHYAMVTIDDGATTASMTDITVKGYAAGSTIGGTHATTKLATLTLANAGNAVDMVVADTAATMALNVSGMGVDATHQAVVTLTAAPTTLNVVSTGANYINLTSAATTALNVSGTGLLDISATDMAALATVKVTGSAGLTLNAGVADTVTSVDTTGTTGTVTVSIQGNSATYAGGAGADIVTVTNPGTAISKSITLGAGNDTLDLSAATPVTPSVVLDGGDGTADTIKLASADAESLSGSATFAAQIQGFERLDVGALTAARAVNLSNLDDISYVTRGTGNFLLTLNNMADGGTLVSAANTSGTTVVLKDASGSANTFNVVAGGAIGTVTVNGVETVNLSVTANSTATIADNAVKTINLSGAKTLTLTTTGDATLTTVDAHAMTKAFTYADDAAGTLAQTITGGSAADVLTANVSSDVLNGGAGNDSLTVADGKNLVTLNGGAGTDTYHIGLASNVNGYATITGTAAEMSGDVIAFGTAIAAFGAAKITLGDTAVFQDYANEAAKGTAADHNAYWFQYNGNTYVVQNNSTSTSFVNGTDAIVKISGLVDLTWNSTAFQLEIA